MCPRYFETKHELTAEHLCKMYGFEYSKADDEASLSNSLVDFFKAGTQPKVLEVFTQREGNDQYLKNYFKVLR